MRRQSGAVMLTGSQWPRAGQQQLSGFCSFPCSKETLYTQTQLGHHTGAIVRIKNSESRGNVFIRFSKGTELLYLLLSRAHRSRASSDSL